MALLSNRILGVGSF